MADIPDGIVLKRHRDLQSSGFNRPLHWAGFALLLAIVALGLANLFAQRPGTQTLTSAAADLELFAPTRARGGLIYEARFTIRAHEDLTHAALMLTSGWLESQTINTIEPSPIAETSRNGDLLLTLGPVKRGQSFTLYIEIQVNPTNVGRRDTDVVLYDGDERLLELDRTLTVFP
jgi:hypothetical protein